MMFLVARSFDLKIGVFQQTLIGVYYIYKAK